MDWSKLFTSIPFWTTFISEFFVAVIQLVFLGMIGGWFSRRYSKMQKNREIKIDLIRELARIHSKFLSIRYEYNTLFLTWGKEEVKSVARDFNEEELKNLKWRYYEEICDLLGDYQGMKSLLVEFFPKEKDQVNFLHTKYEQWRISIREGKPIFQNIDGTIDAALDDIRGKYRTMMVGMRMEV